MKKMFLVAAAATALISTAALASVTFNFDTGVGFVGKGDVQTAFGWNNAQAQNNAPGVTFTVNLENSWECDKIVTLGNGDTHEITIEHNSDTTGVIDSLNRTHNQVDGFILQGYSSTQTTGGPARNTCPNDNSNFVEGSTSSTGGLYVNSNGNSVLLLTI